MLAFLYKWSPKNDLTRQWRRQTTVVRGHVDGDGISKIFYDIHSVCHVLGLGLSPPMYYICETIFYRQTTTVSDDRLSVVGVAG